LVNNAGIVRYGWIEEFSEDDLDQSIAINIRGTINGVRAGLPLMKATPGATLVNIASVASLRGNPKYTIYAATKFAIRGLTQSLDLELSRFGIRTVCIMPWSIETTLLDGSSASGDMTMRESMQRTSQTIYGADYAADAIWEAAHGDAAEVIIGEEGAEFIRRAEANPEKLRAMLKKAVAAGNFD
ncbi:MAG: SDR family NAD(P)-dependent oxidoreductase, partial [Sphingobium sp.]